MGKFISLHGLTRFKGWLDVAFGLVDRALEQIADALAKKYEKPSTGIPKSDLASAVQTALGKADTALQASDIVDSLASEAPNRPISARAVSVDMVDYVDGSISNTIDYIDQQDNNEHNGRVAGDNILDEKISIINGKIPSQASSTNQLADKAFVNSSIATETADFRGTSATGLTEAQFFAWANGLTKNNNDYVFWNTTDSTGNVQFKRYKYNGSAWAYEYTLNNSSFTAAQWAAINSGLTTGDKTALDNALALIATFGDIVTHNAAEFATKAELAGKVDQTVFYALGLSVANEKLCITYNQ